MKKAGTGHSYVCALILVCIILVNGCKKNDGNNASNTSISEESIVKIDPIELEAENQTLSGNLSAATTRKGYSGTGYVTGFKDDSDELTFSVSIDTPGFYDLKFTTAADSSKVNFVLVDGVSVADLSSASKFFADSVISNIYLENGEHSISVKKSWGWFDLDKLTLIQSDPLPKDLYTVKAKLANPNANDTTKRLMSYLIDIYGKQMLTGQNCDTGMIGTECAAINRVVNDYPAVLGLDFMNYSPCNVSHGATANSTDLAIGYAKKGGIVTFCWHWTMPDEYVKGNWYSSFYTDSCTFRLDKALNGEDEAGYAALMDGIDAIAKQLLILQENDVTVLWRPLHEASGGWFWWGAAGADAYKELYILMFNKLTYEYGCNNLIWLWNGQDDGWYPGDEYVDIIGTDIYLGEHVYSSQIDKFLQCTKVPNERKIVVLSENGCLYDPELAARDGAMWGFCCTWGGEFVLKSSKIANYSERYTEKTMLSKVYESEYMITRSELPDLKTYPIRDDFE